MLIKAVIKLDRHDLLIISIVVVVGLVAVIMMMSSGNKGMTEVTGDLAFKDSCRIFCTDDTSSYCKGKISEGNSYLCEPNTEFAWFSTLKRKLRNCNQQKSTLLNKLDKYCKGSFKRGYIKWGDSITVTKNY